MFVVKPEFGRALEFGADGQGCLLADFGDQLADQIRRCARLDVGCQLPFLGLVASEQAAEGGGRLQRVAQRLAIASGFRARGKNGQTVLDAMHGKGREVDELHA